MRESYGFLPDERRSAKQNALVGGGFITQYKFNKLDDRMSKLEKVKTNTKTAEETSVELDGEISMDATITGKFITQQVAVAMSKK